MAGPRNLAIAVAFLAALYQWWAKEFFFAVLGIGRVVEPIENFPYSCRRLVDKQLEGCEDLWLDEDGRVLYAACSGSIARTQWNQGYAILFLCISHISTKLRIVNNPMIRVVCGGSEG